ncbi:HPr family phosphocarrier protein [Collinsella tanakaei]|uniref:HPr family phosphocarrier protein n=1 Tax=Collinsella tanakaei TaxID=626935 RepID=UPI001957C460|nr:HPr family phosphocarrier protein [Collinsella tanakaei]MBM6779371.1 HPr family phosphocarrier protein [Collinsella tanakaei]
MYVKSVTVVNPTGLHARPAAMLATEAAKFDIDVELRNATKDGEFKSARSMLGIMMAGAGAGDTVEFRADGEGEVEAVDALVALVESGCGE